MVYDLALRPGSVLCGRPLFAGRKVSRMALCTLTWHFDQFWLSLRSQPPLNQAVAIKAAWEGKRGKS